MLTEELKKSYPSLIKQQNKSEVFAFTGGYRFSLLSILDLPQILRSSRVSYAPGIGKPANLTENPEWGILEAISQQYPLKRNSI